MHAIELLQTQHRHIEGLFDGLSRANGGRPNKSNLLDEIAQALAIHAAIEERHLYPLTMHAQVIIQSVREHLAIASALTKLVRLHRSGRRSETKLALLRARVLLHVTLEEIYLFPEVKERLREPELEALGQEMLSTMRAVGKGAASVARPETDRDAASSVARR